MKATSDRPTRVEFRLFRPIQTRWADNDAYGHVNNVVHYAWFDTVVNAVLIESGALDLSGEGPIFLVAETGCRYFAALSYPEPVEIGLAIDRLGTSSVTWRLASFATGSDLAASVGRFVHVLVDRQSRRSYPLPDTTRAALSPFVG